MASPVILFGAGASFGAGTTPRPPLGTRTPHSEGLFRELAQEYPATWGSLPAGLQAVFEHDFEAGMRRVFQEHEFEILALQERMAHFFSRFRANGSDAYSRLVAALDDAGIAAIFSTLNYECILEDALMRQKHPVGYFGERSLPTQARLVYKLHGSCNFHMCSIMIHRSSIRQRFVDAMGDLALVSPDDVERLCSSEWVYTPMMAHYAHDKPFDFSSDPVKQAVTQWQQDVHEAPTVVVVGVKPNKADKHIWTRLQQTSARLGFVNRESAYQEMRSLRADVTWVGESFEQSADAIVDFLSKGR